MKYCSNCGEKLGEGNKYCSNCGTRMIVDIEPLPSSLGESEKLCPYCAEKVSVSSKICPNCGKHLLRNILKDDIDVKQSIPSSPVDLYKCPYCDEKIKAEASLCKHCGRDLISKSKKRKSPLFVGIIWGILFTTLAAIPKLIDIANYTIEPSRDFLVFRALLHDLYIHVATNLVIWSLIFTIIVIISRVVKNRWDKDIEYLHRQ